MHKGQSVYTHLFVPAYKRHALFAVTAMLTMIAPATAQTAAPAKAELQQRLAEIKQSVAENQQKLHKYQWTETTQITLKGEPKPPKQSLASYGPDGKVQKTPIGAPQQQQQQQQQQAGGRGGRVKQKIIEKKKEELKDYTDQVKTLLALYVPPDPNTCSRPFSPAKPRSTKAQAQRTSYSTTTPFPATR